MERNEEKEQARLVRWSHTRQVREVMPMLKHLFHVPNGGQRSSFTGAQMKALGVKPGVPDLLLPLYNGTYYGLAIELKHGRGKTSDTQEEWLNHLTANGWMCEVCYSAEEARAVILNFFGVGDDAVPAVA